MGVNEDKYKDLINKYATYGIKGQYIDTFIVKQMIIDELQKFNSYSEIEVFVNSAEIKVKEEEIKEYLDKKMDEEKPYLKKKLLLLADCNLNTEEKFGQENLNGKLDIMMAASRYTFEPYSLMYFKNYVNDLREKCLTLLEIVRDIEKIKERRIGVDNWQRIVDLEFYINEKGDISVEDAIRLINAIIYNVNDLYEKVIAGNNYETYLNFKLYKTDLYPSKEIQIRDLKFAFSDEFIALSQHQLSVLKEEQNKNMTPLMSQSSLENAKDTNKDVLIKKINK